jgi:hypothetical protein
MVLIKNTTAAHLVARDIKFAAPVAPKRLPAEPLPKAEPISAPLPCCSNTKEIMVSEDRICTTNKRVNIQDIERLRKLND